MLNETAQNELVSLRKQIIENEFSNLNPMQKKAVLKVKNPLLVLAGAGSGKTTVLVNRIAHILRWGEAYESDRVFSSYSESEMEEIRKAAEGKETLSDELAEKLSVSRVQPWQILAITFTNKAAGELKERICRKVGETGNDIWAYTFHSACVRILRRYSERLGYDSHFTIYDTDDQKRLIRDCIKALKIDEKMMPVKNVLPEISHAKDSLVSPELMKKRAGNDVRLISIANIYKEYQKRLLSANAMDFDDIIYNTVELFREFPDILSKYQEQFRYIMVDEYQDTNTIQYELVRLLSEKYQNVCVVGDDDQSIYKFRGATVENILEFENDYIDATVIKLEQNYRSTRNILAAANYVIKNNPVRKEKSLWTQNEQGEKIVWYTASDEQDEGSFIVRRIKEGIEQGAKYSDFAVLYRMNTQSQSLERVFVRSRIPYRIIGGRKFFEYREIRDMIAYLNVISNPSDNSRLKRIINIPKRGIGERTIGQIEEISAYLGQSMFETMKQAEEFDALSKGKEKLESFCNLIEHLRELLQQGAKLSEVYETMVSMTDYDAFIKKESERGEGAVDNVHELTTNIMQYEKEHEEDASIQGFLEETALLTDIDAYEEEEEKVVLMTLHSAKGLEFENVFIPGMEENIFPSFQSSLSEGDMQEERRLAYVGVTRAKKRLYMINSESRMLFGHTARNRQSRFLSELPEQVVERKHKEVVHYPNVEIPQPKAVTRKADIEKSKQITSAVKTGAKINYTVGMKVNHKKFGDGIIISVKQMSSDSMLEIAFDTVGTKKLMGNMAPLSCVEDEG